MWSRIRMANSSLSGIEEGVIGQFGNCASRHGHSRVKIGAFQAGLIDMLATFADEVEVKQWHDLTRLLNEIKIPTIDLP
jgi:hypothetical protein